MIYVSGFDFWFIFIELILIGMLIGILIFTYKYYIPMKERIKELEKEGVEQK